MSGRASVLTLNLEIVGAGKEAVENLEFDLEKSFVILSSVCELACYGFYVTDLTPRDDRIANYRKVWKIGDISQTVDGVYKLQETEVRYGDSKRYCGLAKFQTGKFDLLSKATTLNNGIFIPLLARTAFENKRSLLRELCIAVFPPYHEQQAPPHQQINWENLAQAALDNEFMFMRLRFPDHGHYPLEIYGESNWIDQVAKSLEIFYRETNDSAGPIVT